MKDQELNQLIESLLENEISEADFICLEAEFLVNADARQAYYDRSELATLLAAESESKTVVPMPKRGHFRVLAVAAVVGLLGSVATLVFKSTSSTVAKTEPRADGVAFLSDHDAALWNGRELASGDLLPQGMLKLNSGTAKLEFFSGVTLMVSGEAEFELLSPMEMRVVSGEVRARVPDVAKGFRIHTRLGDVVDLGTEFALNVSEQHADVHVLDGEVEFHPVSDEKMRLMTEKSSFRWADGAASSELPYDAAKHVDMVDMEKSLASVRDARRADWLKHVDEWKASEDVLVYFPMSDEGESKEVENFGSAGSNGIAVRAQHVADRWGHEDGALDFSPTGSRVRVDVPGEHHSLTFYCWARIDSLDRWYNSLFLTDGHELNEPHWQIMDDGRLFFSVKAHDVKGRGDPDKHVVYSPSIWTPSLSGKWFQLVTVFDADAASVTHYVNGSAIHTETIPENKRVDTVRIGPASIGNWAQPMREDSSFAVRNLNGAIDEFAILSRPLAAKEIAELYKIGKP
jgi:hypothetical protein